MWKIIFLHIQTYNKIFTFQSLTTISLLDCIFFRLHTYKLEIFLSLFNNQSSEIFKILQEVHITIYFRNS